MTSADTAYLDRVRALSPLDRLCHWVREREAVRLRKETGEPPPWTADPILQRFRFCNAVRIDDKVSRWLLDNWYRPHRGHPNMLAAVALGRFVNRPEALAGLTAGVFRPAATDPRFPFETVEAGLRGVKAAGLPVFGGAYVVSGGPAGRYRDKIDAVVNGYVRAVADADSRSPLVVARSMAATHANVTAVGGYASFMAGQVVADLRWAVDGEWADRDEWAPAGPGSVRGLARLTAGDDWASAAARYLRSPASFLRDLTAVRRRAEAALPVEITARLEMHDWQNVMCETDKYNRTLAGEGRPKQVYPGTGPHRRTVPVTPPPGPGPAKAPAGGGVVRGGRPETASRTEAVPPVRQDTPPPPAAVRVRWFGPVPVRYRPGTSDENVIEEVLGRRCYARPRTGFDVGAGEVWLDLGANVGAFALYCVAKGATAVCFEPDAGSYRLLARNLARYGFTCHNAAVTARSTSSVPFWPRPTRRGRFSAAGPCHHRGTTVPLADATTDPVSVPNVYAGTATVTTAPGGGRWGGVKMDIEGAEGPLIDAGLIPACDKLAVEYHLSRGGSAEALGRRLRVLKDLFVLVDYPAELDRLAASGGTVRSFADRTIRCRGWRG